MPVLDTFTVNGTDYSLQDSSARTSAGTANTNATAALERLEYKPDYVCLSTTIEQATTYSAALAANSFFLWRGYGEVNRRPLLLKTTKAVTAGTQIILSGSNANAVQLALADILINTQDVYVNSSDGKIHYRKITGADTALNFSKSNYPTRLFAIGYSSGFSSSTCFNASNSDVTIKLTDLVRSVGGAGQIPEDARVKVQSIGSIGVVTLGVGQSVTVPAGNEFIIIIDTNGTNTGGEICAYLSYS